MGLLSVKTAEERNKYIVDVYHYGIECHQCSYDYEYWAMQDFISLCYTEVCNTPTTTNIDFTLSCDSTVDFIAESSCVPPTRVIDCNQEYLTQKTLSLEDNNYINLRLAAGDTLYFTFSSFIVNGVEYLNGIRTFQLDSTNYTSTVVGSQTVMTNIINWLNSFNVPDIFFSPSSTNRMIVSQPTLTTWQVTTNYNEDGDELTYGVKIDQDGIVGIEVSSIGGFFTGPFAGSYSMWDYQNEIIRQGYLC